MLFYVYLVVLIFVVLWVCVADDQLVSWFCGGFDVGYFLGCGLVDLRFIVCLGNLLCFVGCLFWIFDFG